MKAAININVDEYGKFTATNRGCTAHGNANLKPGNYVVNATKNGANLLLLVTGPDGKITTIDAQAGNEFLFSLLE